MSIKDTISVGGASIVGSFVPAINPTGATAYKLAPKDKKKKAAGYSHFGSGLFSVTR